jgi:hypothetical protein
MALMLVEPTTLPSTERSWADATEDGDDGEGTPTVQVDSLGLTALSIYDQNKDERVVISQGTNLIQNKYEVAVKLQDLQADPNSPLYSVKSFEELGLYPPAQ